MTLFFYTGTRYPGVPAFNRQSKRSSYISRPAAVTALKPVTEPPPVGWGQWSGGGFGADLCFRCWASVSVALPHLVGHRIVDSARAPVGSLVGVLGAFSGAVGPTSPSH